MNIGIHYRVANPELPAAFRTRHGRGVKAADSSGFSAGGGGRGSSHRSDNRDAYRIAPESADELLAREIEALEDPERWDGLA